MPLSYRADGRLWLEHQRSGIGLGCEQCRSYRPGPATGRLGRAAGVAAGL